MSSDDHIVTRIETNVVGISSIITYHDEPDVEQLRRHADALRDRLDEILSAIALTDA